MTKWQNYLCGCWQFEWLERQKAYLQIAQSTHLCFLFGLLHFQCTPLSSSLWTTLSQAKKNKQRIHLLETFENYDEKEPRWCTKQCLTYTRIDFGHKFHDLLTIYSLCPVNSPKELWEDTVRVIRRQLFQTLCLWIHTYWTKYPANFMIGDASHQWHSEKLLFLNELIDRLFQEVSINVHWVPYSYILQLKILPENRERSIYNIYIKNGTTQCPIVFVRSLYLSQWYDSVEINFLHAISNRLCALHTTASLIC